MKRKVLLFSLLLALALLLAGAAFAEEEPIKCTIEVTPTEMTAPQTVDVSISIANTGDTDMQHPVVLYAPDYTVISDFGTNGEALLAAGDTKTWTGKWDVKQKQLENGEIDYWIKYNTEENGELKSHGQRITQKITYLRDESEEITITRSISPETARKGQTVTVTYDITNSGNVDLSSITVKENSSISKKTAKISKLEPGKTNQVKFEVKMGTKNLTSGATISYKSGTSSKSTSKKIEEKTIVYGEPKMTTKLTSSAKGVLIDGTFTLTLELSNSGNIEYTDLRVMDETLGEVFSGQKLGAKGTDSGKLTLTKELTLTKTTTYQFTITAVDNTNNEVKLTSDAITVTAVDPDKMLHLSVEVSPDRTEVHELPGKVRFSIVVTNDSEVDATNVKILHAATEIYTIPSLKAGQSQTLNRDTTISRAGKYQFTASCEDALGDTQTYRGNEMQIAYAAPTPPPATALPAALQTAVPTFQPSAEPRRNDGNVGRTYKSISNIVMPALVLVALLLLASVTLLAIAAKKRADQKRASEAAYDHLERAKRRDYRLPGEEDGVQAKVLAPSETVSANDEGELDADELAHMQYTHSDMGRSSFGTYGEESIGQDDLLGGYDYATEYDQQDYQGYDADNALYDEEQPTVDAVGYDDYDYSTPYDAQTDDYSEDMYAQDDRMAEVAPTATYDGAEPLADMGDYSDYSSSEESDSAYLAASNAPEYQASTETGRRRRTRSAYPSDYQE